MHNLPPRLPSSQPEDHRIDTIPGSAPPCQAPYRVNPLEQKEIKAQIEDLLQRGLIRPSSSPYGYVFFSLKRRMAHIICVLIIVPSIR